MKFRSFLFLTFCNLYFVIAGLLLIPYAGFQHDEAAFADAIFQGGSTFYSWHLGHRWYPLMINSYAGALKTWIYWPIFKVWRPSPYSLRMPVLLIAALSMVVFWPIMVRAGGRRAAVIASVLLATDSMYLMTSVFDWGPCALQHLFLVSVMLAFIRYQGTGKPALLGLASFLAGVAVWEKALFFWLAGGLVAAGLAIYPRYIWQHLSKRNLAIAVGGFSLGAAPFLLYNVHTPNATLRENAVVSTGQFASKLEAARRTLNAHALFNYIVFDDWMPLPRESSNAIEKTSLQLRNATGMSQRNYMPWAYGLSLLLIPFAWRTRAWRPTLFALIFCATGWALMLITRNAGAAAHHVILLWPVMLLFLSLPLAEASRRLPNKTGIPALCVIVGFLAAKNVLVTNEYLAQFIRNGPTVLWTNALYPLSMDLLHSQYAEVDGIDWGTVIPLRVLERGTLPLAFLNVDANSPQAALAKMKSAGVVFLGHTRGLEVFAGVNDKLDAIAAKNGMAKQVIKTYPDKNGRPTFELYRYVHLPDS